MIEPKVRGPFIEAGASCIKWRASFFSQCLTIGVCGQLVCKASVSKTVIIDDCVFKLYFFNAHKN